MELKRSEGEISELVLQYERLLARLLLIKDSDEIKAQAISWDYPPILDVISDLFPKDIVQSDDAGDVTSNSTPIDIVNPLVQEAQDKFHQISRTSNPTETFKEMVAIIQSIKLALLELQPRMDKFQKRLDERDPVTEKPRYGAQTQTRVQILLQTYQALAQIMQQHDEHAIKLVNVVEMHDKQAALEREREYKLQQEEAQRLEAEQQVLMEEAQRFEAERLAKMEAERLELARRAEIHRLERLEAQRQQEAAEQAAKDAALAAEQAWIDSIAKGEDGMREQLIVLKQSCSIAQYKNAIKALHTLFRQIVSRPEEAKFRVIRLNHEKFLEDIGQFKGGQEFFIAAGFVLTNMQIDQNEVSCLFSKEPHLESDMDGWSDWFYTMKNAVKVLEEAIDSK